MRCRFVADFRSVFRNCPPSLESDYSWVHRIPIMLANHDEDNMHTINAAPANVKLTATCLVAILLSFAAGCSNAARSDSTSSAALPTLSIAGNDSAADSGDQGFVRTAQHTEADDSSDDSDADTKSLVADLESNFQAWKQGKAYDFQPAANRIVKRLKNHFDVNQFRFAFDAADICKIAGAYGPSKQIYTAIDQAAERSNNELFANSAKEAVKNEVQQLNLVGTRPKIEGAVYNGGNLNWNDYKGKVVLLDFWATFCPPCVAELPNVERTYRKYHDQGFEVVGISLDDNKTTLADFLDKQKLPWTIMFDENPERRSWDGAAMTKDFFVTSIPATFLIDRKGRVVSIYSRGEQLERQVKKLLAERP